MNVAAYTERIGRIAWVGRVIALDGVDSTNDELKRLAAAGAPAGTIVLADHQRGGRGRRGRSWYSPRGQGLYVSALFRPAGSVADAPRWTLAGAVAACEACRGFTGAPVRIEWPNDLVSSGKKLGGVLAELRSQGGKPTELVLGTGLNVLQRAGEFPAELAANATSLRMLTGRSADRSELAEAYLKSLGQLAALLDAGAWGEVRARWELAAEGAHGRRVRVVQPAGDGVVAAFCGTTQGVDDHGALRVERDGGGMEAVRSAGTVEALEP